MMPFVIFAQDAADSLEARAAARPAHLERLDRLQADLAEELLGVGREGELGKEYDGRRGKS